MPTRSTPVWPELLRHEPFAQMSSEHQDRLLANARRLHYRRGDTVLSPAQGPAERLLIVLSGQVSAEDMQTGETFVELLPGEMFPLGALTSRRAVTNHYRAVGDLSLLHVPEADFHAVLADSAPFQQFCAQRLAHLLSRSRQQPPPGLAGQGMSLHTPLSGIIRRPTVTCRPDAPLRQVLAVMQQENIGSTVITSPEQRLLGIFTLRDLLAAHLKHVDDNTPVDRLMRKPASILPPDALASEAILLLAQTGERHVMVCDGPHLVGLVTEHDLYRLSRLDLKELLVRLAQCDSTAALAGVATTFRRQALQLFRQGMEADAATRLFSLFNDQLVQRLCQLHIADAGLGDDVSLTWLQFGSHGRQEPTLTADQDNGLLFSARDPLRQQEIGQRLPALGQAVCSALSVCGIPLCRNGIMAGNPTHCLSAEDWQDTFLNNLMADPASAGHIGLYLDMRAGWGDRAPASALADTLHRHASANPMVMKALLASALRQVPPLSWSGRLLADDDSRLDLKPAAQIFVDGARLMALMTGSRASRSADRFSDAASLPGMGEGDARAYADSLQFLQSLRLRHQQGSLEAGLPLDNLLPLEQLSPLDYRILKETLRQGRKLQQWLARHVA